MVSLMVGLRQAGWGRRITLVVVAALAAVAFDALPASAVFRPGGNPNPPLQRGANTQLTLTATGPGQSINGYIANPGSTFDPTKGYPPAADVPPPDFSTKDEGFAGVI
jgi:hypothetical protein